MGSTVGVLGFEVVVDLDVQVAAVLFVGAVVERALDLLALLDGQDVLEVEDSLLPVGVLGMGTGREADRLVAGGELDIKPGHEGVDEIVPSALQVERTAEGQVGGFALV